VGPRAGLDTVSKRKIPSPRRVRPTELSGSYITDQNITASLEARIIFHHFHKKWLIAREIKYRSH
jgi:hypothetical protein